MNYKDYAYCGFDCRDCPMFKNNKCLGCRKDNIFECCKNCNVKKCCIEHNTDSCGICKEFPCNYCKQNFSKSSLQILEKISKQ